MRLETQNWMVLFPATGHIFSRETDFRKSADTSKLMTYGKKCQVFLDIYIFSIISPSFTVAYEIRKSRRGVNSNVAYGSQRDINLFRPNPGRKEKIKLSFYFHTILWCLKTIYEGLKVFTVICKLLKRKNKVVPPVIVKFWFSLHGNLKTEKFI